MRNLEESIHKNKTPHYATKYQGNDKKHIF